MSAVNVAEHARQLLDAHGDKAEAEAAQKAAILEAEGKAQEAESWRRVRAAIHQLRAPRAT